jgi:hypothetical protein
MYWHAIGHIHSLTFTQTHTRTYIYTYARTFPSFRCCNCTHTRAEVLANRQMPAGGRWLDHFFTSCDQSTVWLKHCLTKTLCDQNNVWPKHCVTKTLPYLVWPKHCAVTSCVCCHFLCVLSLPMCVLSLPYLVWPTCHSLTNLSLPDQLVTCLPCVTKALCVYVCVCVCVCVCVNVCI